jgi:crotonobetainyl-CoA:carnitine CoA-transferase CaiB-like acyl-CoA transferase
MLSGGLPCYNYYRAADGRYLAVGALEMKFWERLCDAIGRLDLKSKHLARGEEGRRTIAELQAIFGGRNSDHWMEVFRDVDCCVTVVLTLEEAIETAQTTAREMVQRTECPELGGFLEFAPPLKMSDFAFEANEPGSRGRTHTAEILSATGYSAAEIASFRASGIVGGE